MQKRETKAIPKLCVREILSLSFACGAYSFEFRGRNLVCFAIAIVLLTMVSRIISMANSRRKQGRHACALRFHPCRTHNDICSLDKKNSKDWYRVRTLMTCQNSMTFLDLLKFSMT